MKNQKNATLQMECKSLNERTYIFDIFNRLVALFAIDNKTGYNRKVLKIIFVFIHSCIGTTTKFLIIYYIFIIINKFLTIP